MPEPELQSLLDQRLLATLLDALDDAVVVLNASGKVVLFNAGAVQMFGYPANEILGRSLDALLPEGSSRRHEHHYRAFLASEERSRPMGRRSLINGRRADGELFPVAATIVKARSGDGTVGAAILRDISEQQETEAELLRLSSTDVLTGLCNRRSLLQSAERDVAHAHQTGAPMSMLLLDMDHFKSINDRHGHLEGDRVLVRMADCLRAALREGDVGGRLGGEEFAVLLPRTPLAAARQVAERLRLSLASHADFQPQRATVSIGVAELRSGEVLDDLMRRADHALYQAKAEGRNRVCLADA